MTLKVAIIGKGKVGGALAEGLRRGGYDTRFGTRDPGESVEDAAKWGDIVIMAVYPKSWADLIQRADTNLNGKIVIDVSNPVTETFDPVFDASTSAAEELQKMVPSARIVKAFNTIYARGMSDGLAKGQQQTVFVAGDDTDARKAVMEMAAKIGFDSVDTGPLKNARLLESFERLSFQLAFVMKMGPGIGFKLIHQVPRPDLGAPTQNEKGRPLHISEMSALKTINWNGECMSQTSAIILKFDEKHATEFERMFESEVLPLWRKFKSDGKFIAASLTPVEGGNQMKRSIRKYILQVEVPSMAEHEEFDSNALFNKFLSKAKAMQPEEPLVMFGETLFQV